MIFYFSRVTDLTYAKSAPVLEYQKRPSCRDVVFEAVQATDLKNYTIKRNLPVT